MTYYVLAPDGSRYGPADLALLTRWAAEGRVTAGTLIEDSMGRRHYAASLEGLQFGLSRPPGAYAFDQSGPDDDGYKEILWAWGLGASSLLICPVLPSLVGIAMAVRAKEKGQRAYVAPMTFCVVAAIANVVILTWVLTAMDSLSFRT